MRVLAIIFIVLCAISCAEIKRSTGVLLAEAYYVFDDKEYCDCLSTTEPDEKYNRTLKIRYKLRNETNETYCIPFPDEYDSCNSAHPYINVCFTNGVDSVFPYYLYKASRNHLLAPGDSLSIYIRICRFYNWGVSWCSADNDLSELMDMLRVTYCPDSTSVLDKYMEIPKIDFVKGMSRHTRINNFRYDSTIVCIMPTMF